MPARPLDADGVPGEVHVADLQAPQLVAAQPKPAEDIRHAWSRVDGCAFTSWATKSSANADRSERPTLGALIARAGFS